MQFCRMFKQIKENWDVSWVGFTLIFTTFALGGTLCARIGGWLVGQMKIDSAILSTIVYIIVVTLVWPLCVLLISMPLGQLGFFSNYLVKMARRMTGKALKREAISVSFESSAISNYSSAIRKEKRIAIFASGAGTNAKKIIEHFSLLSASIQSVEKRAVKIVLIVCNNPKAGVLYIAAEHGIPVLMVNRHSLYKEDICLKELQLHQIDLIVLAGFLWMIPQNIINAYRNRIINIHPALLPKFGGKGMYGDNVHKAVIEAGEKETGITIHYVDEHYDNGDVIFQAKCKVKPDDTPASLAERVHRLEHEHYARVIENLAMKL